MGGAGRGGRGCVGFGALPGLLVDLVQEGADEAHVLAPELDGEVRLGDGTAAQAGAVVALGLGDDRVGDGMVVGELSGAAVDLADRAATAPTADRVGEPRLVETAEHGLSGLEVDDLARGVDRHGRHRRSLAFSDGAAPCRPTTESRRAPGARPRTFLIPEHRRRPAARARPLLRGASVRDEHAVDDRRPRGGRAQRERPGAGGGEGREPLDLLGPPGGGDQRHPARVRAADPDVDRATGRARGADDADPLCRDPGPGQRDLARGRLGPGAVDVRRRAAARPALARRERPVVHGDDGAPLGTPGADVAGDVTGPYRQAVLVAGGDLEGGGPGRRPLQGRRVGVRAQPRPGRGLAVAHVVAGHARAAGVRARPGERDRGGQPRGGQGGQGCRGCGGVDLPAGARLADDHRGVGGAHRHGVGAGREGAGLPDPGAGHPGRGGVEPALGAQPARGVIGVGGRDGDGRGRGGPCGDGGRGHGGGRHRVPPGPAPRRSGGSRSSAGVAGDRSYTRLAGPRRHP